VSSETTKLDTDPALWETIPPRVGIPDAKAQSNARRQLNELSEMRAKGLRLSIGDHQYLAALWLRAKTRQLSGVEIINLDAIYYRLVEKKF
jgi:hypothetical protein